MRSSFRGPRRRRSTRSSRSTRRAGRSARRRWSGCARGTSLATRASSPLSRASTRARCRRWDRSGSWRTAWSCASAMVMWAWMTGQSWSSTTFSAALQTARWKARWPSCRRPGPRRRPSSRTRPRRGARREPAAGRVGEDAARREVVEGHAGPGQVAQGVHVEVGDAEAAVGLRHDEPLAGQLAERLADRRAADLQVRGERELGQLVPRPQRADDDAAPDLGHARPRAARPTPPVPAASAAGARVPAARGARGAHGGTLAADCQTINARPRWSVWSRPRRSPGTAVGGRAS